MADEEDLAARTAPMRDEDQSGGYFEPEEVCPGLRVLVDEFETLKRGA